MNRDDPNIRPKEFLYAVMHDKTLPLTQRIKAAGKLMRIEPDGPPTPVLKVVIPYMSDLWFRSFSPELQRDLLWIKRCFELGIVDPDIDHWDVKGHA